MAILNILIGLSGSGKSTFAHMKCDHDKDVIVSSDNVRGSLYGNEEIQGEPREVFDEMFNRTRRYLEMGFNVWYDSTNLSQRHRRALINKLKHNYQLIPKIHYWFILTTPEECIARQELRKRKVPEEVILKQLQNFRLPYPNLSEEYDELHFVNTSTNEIYGHEELKKTIGFNQNNKHHSLDLYNHLMKTGKLMAKNYTDRSQNYFVIQTGFYHDIGKLYCQTTDEEGESHYYNHQNVSAYLFLCYFIDKYSEFKEEIYNAALAIQGHMEPYSLSEVKIRKRYCAVTNTILKLHKADVEAH